MEQITKVDGIYYYGKQACKDADAAYGRFRGEYHMGLGRQVFKRLDRLGQRQERVHGFGFVFEGGSDYPGDFGSLGRAEYRIIGLVGICYCRIIGIWDIPEGVGGRIEEWLDWAFSRGSGALSLVDRKSRSGRTSKRLKTRYK